MAAPTSSHTQPRLGSFCLSPGLCFLLGTSLCPMPLILLPCAPCEGTLDV